MSINIKVLGILIAAFLYGCSGNSGSSNFEVGNNIKRFSGVVNNASVKGIYVAAIPIGKHGQFRLDSNNNVEALTNSSDENGRYGFGISTSNVGPYVLTVTAPSFDSESEANNAAKMSCQLAANCSVKGEVVSFGEFYSVDTKRQWSAAVETISSGQFIVINPITEMAKAFGYTTYINDGIEADLGNTSKSSANYYSNYGIVKGNSQTAALLGLGDILSKEPANLALLHNLNVNASTGIEESIRYGALLAAWQKLELEYNKDVLDGDPTFQQVLIKEFLVNQGQLYQSAAPAGQILSLSQWYTTARDNLIEVKQYHAALNRSLPGEIERVIDRFEEEIDALNLNAGELTAATPVINGQYIEDYHDAVVKTKAMINYVSTLNANFATSEYRDSIKASSALITSETRRLSPEFDRIFQSILSIYQYYLSCTHGACDSGSEWHASGNTFDSSNNTLMIEQPAGTKLELSQELVFDDRNPEGSTESNIHDLFLVGAIELNKDAADPKDELRLELSDFSDENTVGVRSSVRFSFSKAVSQLPQQPNKLDPGMGATEDEDLVPDYIELVLPSFKLYDPSKVDAADEIKLAGSLTALMIANTDAGDLLKAPEERLGKRYNLANIKSTLRLSGQYQGATSSEAELRDNALFYLEASASEAFVSGKDFTAYFPDTQYPKFEAFFKPREGFEIGTTSPFPLVVSRKGTMNFPKLDTDGNASETEEVEVEYIELDYEIGGLERYIVYPKLAGDDQYWGLICTAQPEDEDDLTAAGQGYTKTAQDSQGNEYQRSLLACPIRDKYDGSASPDDFINQVYVINKDVVNLREYNGHGAYRINYPITGEKLDPFPAGETSHNGTLEQSIVLGVDSMRMQFKPNLVSQSGTSFLPESMLDISLEWRTHDLIDVNAFLAFDTERVVNNPNGSGLPYLAVGSDSESYSIAYRTDAEGNESGEYVMTWAGVHFVDGGQKMERTFDENLKEGVFANVGSNVSYQPDSDTTDEKCGFFARGTKPTAGEECDAIAYFTFRGLVTGSLRQEQDNVYVIRYIDGSWQILGQ